MNGDDGRGRGVSCRSPLVDHVGLRHNMDVGIPAVNRPSTHKDDAAVAEHNGRRMRTVPKHTLISSRDVTLSRYIAMVTGVWR